jgi:hypothetical protein
MTHYLLDDFRKIGSRVDRGLASRRSSGPLICPARTEITWTAARARNRYLPTSIPTRTSGRTVTLAPVTQLGLVDNPTDRSLTSDEPH